jgi:hypothetical protein
MRLRSHLAAARAPAALLGRADLLAHAATAAARVPTALLGSRHALLRSRLATMLAAPALLARAAGCYARV